MGNAYDMMPRSERETRLVTTYADEVYEKKRAAEARGQRFIITVPPIRFERIIYHELTHVLQQSYDAPLWFLEASAPARLSVLPP